MKRAWIVAGTLAFLQAGNDFATAGEPVLGAAVDVSLSPSRERDRGQAPAHRPNTLLVKFKGIARVPVSAIEEGRGGRAAREFKVPRSLRRSSIGRWQRLTLEPGQDAESVRRRLAQNPAVEAVELDFLSADGSGYASDVIDAILYATAMGAKVLNHSWGSGAYSRALEDAIAAADGAGALFVAAAGKSSGGLNAGRALEDDAVPPDPTPLLEVVASRARRVTLAWTATGDDGSAGRASLYDLRYSTSLIDDGNFDSATRVAGVPAPGVSGTPETFEVTGFRPQTLYYFAVKVVDNVGNASTLSPAVSAATPPESIVFSDDMEAGPENWRIEGSDGAGGPALWHLSTHRSSSPTTAFYYGLESTLNFDTGARNVGSITSPPIDLSGRHGSWLSFRHFLQTENFPWFDVARVYVSTEDGARPTKIYENFAGTRNRMVEVGVDLSSYDGQVVSLLFEFNSGDAFYNGFEGWVIDDVVVSSEAVSDDELLRLDVNSVENGLGFVRVSAPARPEEYCLGARGSIQSCSYLFQPGTVVNLDALPEPDSVFMGWLGACSGPTPTCQVMVTDDLFVGADFRGPQPIQVDANSVEYGLGLVRVSAPGRPREYCHGSRGSIQSCSYLFQPGTVVNLDALPEPDSVFMGWLGACSGPTPTCQVMVTDDLFVGADFRGPQPIQVDANSVEYGLGLVRVSAPGRPEEYCHGSRGSIQSCSYLFQPGTVVNLDALPEPDSVFMGWLGACAGPTPTCQVMVTDDLFVGADFRGPQPLQLDVSSVENGLGLVRVSAQGRPDEYCIGTRGTIQTCGYLFQPGTVVTLDALSEPDSVFMGWLGACSGPTPTCQVMVTDDLFVGADFRGPQPIQVYVNSVENGLGFVRVSAPARPEEYCLGARGSIQGCSYLFQPGTVVNLDALPEPDSVFMGWLGACSGPTPTCQVMVTDDLFVGADFRGPQPLGVDVSSSGNGAGGV